MKPSNFDELTKALATSTSRREVLKPIAVFTLGSILGLSWISNAFARACVANGRHCNSKTPCCSGFCNPATKTCACGSTCNSTCPCPDDQNCVSNTCVCPGGGACGPNCPCPTGESCISGTCCTCSTAGQDCLSNGTCVTPCSAGCPTSCPHCATDIDGVNSYCWGFGTTQGCSSDANCPSGCWCVRGGNCLCC